MIRRLSSISYGAFVGAWVLDGHWQYAVVFVSGAALYGAFEMLDERLGL